MYAFTCQKRLLKKKTLLFLHLLERRTGTFASSATVLVLAGIKLIFFVVASIRLFFEFVQKPVLIIQGCVWYCWAVLTQSQGLFCLSHHPPASRLRVHKKLGGDTARTAEPNWPKGYSTPYDVMLSIYSWQKKKEGVMAFVFPSNS